MSTEGHFRAPARAELARLLATCFRDPGPVLASERVRESLREVAAGIDPGLGDALRRVADALVREPPESLRRDYARLFRGLAEAPARPYGSVWLDEGGPLMGDSTMAVLQHYEDGGFELDQGFRDLPDHVAVELEYLSVLLFREAEALGRGDPATLRGASTLRSRFLADHLGAWIAPFATAVRQGAECAFYRELADLAERFVAMESARGPPA